VLLSSTDSAVLPSPFTVPDCASQILDSGERAWAVRGDGAGNWPSEREKLGWKQGKDCVGVHSRREAASRGQYRKMTESGFVGTRNNFWR
jgi:hypothetical protein